MKRSGRFNGLAALLLFGVFAVCILSVLLTGAKTYRALSERGAEEGDRRVCAQYLSARVRQSDRAGAIGVDKFGDGDALVLRETVGGSECETRVYVHDGYLNELFCLAGAGLSPGDGQRIMPAEGLEAEVSGGLVTLRVTSGGETVELTLCRRSGGDAI